ncbi:MAG: membrane protein insertion efficiency factor YidD [Candidatus Zixiibacteriota bacterium]
MKWLIFTLFFILNIGMAQADDIKPPHADPDAPIANHDSLLKVRIPPKYNNPDMDASINPKIIGKAQKDRNTNATNPVKMLADLLFRLYSRFITPQDDQKCQFELSCSAYARKAFRCQNPVKAALMTSDRLLRCNPVAYKYYGKNQNEQLIDNIDGVCNE